ncbi:hypothetical protein FOB72_27975 [Cupriavidus pauculus]|uniref:Uncharacterized protein n=1 Tax=Cupriavidus pauculus TaxID=82633 RepID=A0A5P2HC23_9BURK|nr:hypothetical protein [Cupriavidus pauculus]QET05807.1 hypothetical protein FOB72_27975 [Cupriavidus pauculus]
MDILMLMLAATYAQPSPDPGTRRANVAQCLRALSDPTRGRTLAERCVAPQDDPAANLGADPGGDPGGDPVARYAASRACAAQAQARDGPGDRRTRRQIDPCTVRVQLVIALYRLLTGSRWDTAAFGTAIDRAGLGQPSGLHGTWTPQFERHVRDHAHAMGPSWRRVLDDAFRDAATAAIAAAGNAHAALHYVYPVTLRRGTHAVTPHLAGQHGAPTMLANIDLAVIHFQQTAMGGWRGASDRDWQTVLGVATRWHERYAAAADDATLPAHLRDAARAARWHAYVVREQISNRDPSEIYLYVTRHGAPLGILRATVSEDPEEADAMPHSDIEDLLLAPDSVLALPGQPRLIDIDSFAIQAYLDLARDDGHRTVTFPVHGEADAALAYRNGFRPPRHDEL